jgi:hypothetical protein
MSAAYLFALALERRGTTGTDPKILFNFFTKNTVIRTEDIAATEPYAKPI